MSARAHPRNRVGSTVADCGNRAPIKMTREHRYLRASVGHLNNDDVLARGDDDCLLATMLRRRVDVDEDALAADEVLRGFIRMPKGIIVVIVIVVIGVGCVAVVYYRWARPHR